MADLDHFDMQPLQFDPQSKFIYPNPNIKPSRTLAKEISALNTLHRALTHTHAPESVLPSGVPPPPVPVHPKRSAQVTKLRDQAIAEHNKGRHADALKLYTLAVQMAEGRPLWEPSALTREELSGLYGGRAATHMALLSWAEASVDAETSVEVKRVGNAKGWWRRGRCLVEMGRLEEARDWVRRGLEIESENAELTALLEEIEGRLSKA